MYFLIFKKKKRNFSTSCVCQSLLLILASNPGLRASGRLSGVLLNRVVWFIFCILVVLLLLASKCQVKGLDS